KAVDESRIDTAVENPRGALDRLAALVESQSGREELAIVEHLGKAVELGTIAEVVGPHGQDDVDGKVLGPGGRKEKRDEVDRLVAIELAVLRLAGPPHAAVAEDLLELVDQEQELAIAEDLPTSQHFHQPKRASAEGRLEEGLAVVEARPGLADGR